MIPGSERSPGEGNGNPRQYSCLENPTDRGAWQATVHEVSKSRVQLTTNTHTHTHTHTHTKRGCAHTRTDSIKIQEKANFRKTDRLTKKHDHISQVAHYLRGSIDIFFSFKYIINFQISRHSQTARSCHNRFNDM